MYSYFSYLLKSHVPFRRYVLKLKFTNQSKIFHKFLILDKQNKSLAQVLREKNSRNRFVSELTKSEDQIFNRSLDSAQNSLSERKPNMKQTKLLIRRSVKRPIDRQTDCFTTLDQMETKTELFIIPSPKKRILESKVKLNNTVGGYEHIIERPTCSMSNNKRQGENVRDTTKTQDLMAQSGRNMLMLVGKVDYVLKISKMYPKLNILWDVYGKCIFIFIPTYVCSSKQNQLSENLTLKANCKKFLKAKFIMSIFYSCVIAKEMDPYYNVSILISTIP